MNYNYYTEFEKLGDKYHNDLNETIEALEVSRASLLDSLEKPYEIRKAVEYIQDALLQLDHYKRRREAKGIFTMDIPESTHLEFDKISKLGLRKKLRFVFGKDSREGFRQTDELLLENVPVSQEFGLVMSYLISKLNYEPVYKVEDRRDIEETTITFVLRNDNELINFSEQYLSLLENLKIFIRNFDSTKEVYVVDYSDEADKKFYKIDLPKAISKDLKKGTKTQPYFIYVIQLMNKLSKDYGLATGGRFEYPGLFVCFDKVEESVINDLLEFTQQYRDGNAVDVLKQSV